MFCCGAELVIAVFVLMHLPKARAAESRHVLVPVLVPVHA
jgi:hypothetical protein